MLPIYDRDEKIPDTLYDSLVRRVIEHVLTLNCSPPSDSLFASDTIDFYKSLGALRELLFAIQRICCVRVCFDIEYRDDFPYRLYNLKIDEDLLVYKGMLAPFFKNYITKFTYDITDFRFFEQPVSDDCSDLDMYVPFDRIYIQHEVLSPDNSI